jgi:hypothetical protein
MFEFLSAKLRCVRVSSKWFSMSSGDFFDEILKKEIIYNNWRIFRRYARR